MFSFFAKTFKFGIVTAGLIALAGMAAFATVGKDRTHAAVGEMHSQLLDAIDANINDPTALRGQLREMEQQYPKRIAQVRGDLAEVSAEISSLNREVAISKRVVALADHDLERLEGQLASQLPVGVELVAIKAVTLDDHVYSVSKARARLNQIRNTRVAYSNRAADGLHDLMYLQKQELRLDELLVKLDGERAEFSGQILGLSRQIDSIARNDRLIKLLEKRNRTIDECSRYEAVSLDQIAGRLAQIKNRQEAELEMLANEEQEADYEDLARMQIATEHLETKRSTYAEIGSVSRNDI
jgi:predicted negative regulator of RcsB-dependent stress response